jgi:pilus assembly protein CpaE
VTGIVLAAPGDELLDRVRRSQTGHDTDVRVVAVSSDDDAERSVKELTLSNPDVVVLGPELENETALAIAEAFDLLRPEVAVILVAPRNTPNLRVLLEHALRAGVRDVVVPDSTVEEIGQTLDRALETAARRRTAALAGQDNARWGRVIVVVSPKGGAGKTTISTNLAVGLAKRKPRDVVLVDGDLQFGDVANALRLVPERTSADAAGASTPDATALKVFLTPHPTGLFALCGPEQPGEADDVSPESLSRWVQMLAEQFAFVVVDTDSGLSEHTLAIAELATDFVFVCATDVPSVRGMRKAMESLELIGLTAATRILVLNRADARVGLSLDDIQMTLDHKIDIAVPSTRTVPLSMNQGTPLLETGVSSPAAPALLDLTNRFVPLEAPARRRRRGGDHR